MKRRGWDASRLVFIDETGSNAAMARRIGWSPSGERVSIERPVHGKNVSVIGAIALDGVRGSLIVEGPVNRDVFLTYLREVLCPNLRKGDIVVLDNLSVHKVDGVRELIEAAGATLCYQPPYSPDFNPIELMWAWVKAQLRASTPRTVPRVVAALTRLIPSVSPELCEAWFRHCGIHPQPS